METTTLVQKEKNSAPVRRQGIQQLLEQLPPSRRNPTWPLLALELDKLYAIDSQAKPAARFFAKLFSTSPVHERVHSKAILRKSLLQLLCAFLDAPEFALIAKRFGYSKSEGVEIFSHGAIRPWLVLWSLRHFPHLSRLLFERSQQERYTGLQDIPLNQFIAWSPLFVLYRLSNMANNPIQMSWIRWIAKGKNIRDANFLPFPLTKRMAHWLTLAPRYVTFSGAFLYCQVRAFGGSDALFNALRQFGGMQVQLDPFRRSIIRFMARNKAELDIVQVRPLLGYLEHRSIESKHFSLKGRNMSDLLRQSTLWYEAQQRQNTRNAYRVPHIWVGASYGGFRLVHQRYTYQIIQLTSISALQEEGAEMRHCVADYAQPCASGDCSIWSLRQLDIRKDEMTRLVTIEVDNTGKIVQARGPYNAEPDAEQWTFIRTWAAEERLVIMEA